MKKLIEWIKELIKAYQSDRKRQREKDPDSIDDIFGEEDNMFIL